MDSRAGYSHAYELSPAKLDDINSRRKKSDSWMKRRHGSRRYGSVLFEMRSEFIIVRMEGDRNSIGSERYDFGSNCAGMEAMEIGSAIKWRLEQYWMSEDGMEKLFKEAADFGLRRVAACGGGDVGAIIRMEVMTVQQEGEPFDQTKMRALLPAKFTPLHLCLRQTMVRREMSQEFIEFLFNRLDRRRPRSHHLEPEPEPDLEEEEEEDCSICLVTGFTGAFITELDCGCAFHSHCIVRKLERDNKCPNCGYQVFDATYLTAPSETEWWSGYDELYHYEYGVAFF